jgi:hypothetical protein
LLDSARRYSWAILAGSLIGLIPIGYLGYSLLTTGFPQTFWGPFGRITTAPGYLIVERLCGYSVPLGATEMTYSRHLAGWLVMLGVNLAAWVIGFALAEAFIGRIAVRWRR